MIFPMFLYILDLHSAMDFLQTNSCVFSTIVMYITDYSVSVSLLLAVGAECSRFNLVFAVRVACPHRYVSGNKAILCPCGGEVLLKDIRHILKFY